MNPAPIADHAVPFHRATPLLGTPAIAEKVPPMTRSPFGITQAVSMMRVLPSAAAMPRTDQVVPFQLCTVPNATATRSPFGMTARSLTVLMPGVPKPAPIADHDVPFQRAMLATPVPPACENVPAATRSLFGITASAVTTPNGRKPEPNADHVSLTGSHAAMPLAATGPATSKSPPKTITGAAGPGPSGSHSTDALTAPEKPASADPGNQTASHWACRQPRPHARTRGATRCG